MNIEKRIKTLESSFLIGNVLPKKDCVQALFLPCHCCNKEEWVRTEQERIKNELHAKHGAFDESNITWVVFSHPFASKEIH